MEGLLLPSTCRRLPYGSHDINQLMAKLLAGRGVTLSGSQAIASADVEFMKIASLRAAGAEAAAAAGATALGAPAAAAAAPLADGNMSAGEVRQEGRGRCLQTNVHSASIHPDETAMLTRGM